MDSSVEPIISPWLFYIINLSHNMKALSAALAVVFAFLFLGLFLVYKTASREELSEGEAEGLNMVGGYSRLSGVLVIIFMILGLVLPSSGTGIQMLIASYVTEKNVKAVTELTDLLKESGIEDVKDTIRQLDTGDASETN